ncbi:MAG: response regulator transcription factor [Bacteroidales bacterium]|nr:response regulator transcription factor [Bacteroidales bacterium]
MEKIKIILVDDHSLVRGGIKSLIEKETFIKICGEADSGFQLFNLLEKELVNLVIMDIAMPEMSGIEVTKRLKEKYPDIKVLILSMYTDEEYILSAINSGASGYLPKNTTKQDLLLAIKTIMEGRDYYSNEVSEIMLNSYLTKAKRTQSEQKNGLDLLTKREKEILSLVVDGVGNQQIADSLFISVRTVESHKTHIMQKLEINSVAELVKFAIKNKITNIS